MPSFLLEYVLSFSVCCDISNFKCKCICETCNSTTTVIATAATTTFDFIFNRKLENCHFCTYPVKLCPKMTRMLLSGPEILCKVHTLLFHKTMQRIICCLMESAAITYWIFLSEILNIPINEFWKSVNLMKLWQKLGGFRTTLYVYIFNCFVRIFDSYYLWLELSLFLFFLWLQVADLVIIFVVNNNVNIFC